MSTFEFVFSLFGLLLGLALAEALGGFSKAVKARSHVRVGWLTPLLGLLVMLDLVSFWVTAWSLRDALPVRFWLLLVLAHTGLDYLAATLIFPDDPRSTPDFDAHYFANKRFVLAAMFLANVPTYAVDYARGRSVFLSTPMLAVITVTFFILLPAAWVACGKRINVIVLVLMIALYPSIGSDRGRVAGRDGCKHAWEAGKVSFAAIKQTDRLQRKARTA